MMVINILIGLVGLGVVVFVHELGHLIAAKAVGIEVEAFSLGWGKKLVGYTWRGTEYRISIFPIGGYCKMKGERSYAEALDKNEDTIHHEPGDFFAAAPWRRIVTLLAGPVANVVLAILILTVVWWVGFSVESYENRIVLASDYAAMSDSSATPAETEKEAPANLAGLQTGDRIVSINGNPVASYGDLQQIVAQNALTKLRFQVERDGRRLEIDVTPALVPETGSGFIGVYPWVEPVVATVSAGSVAESAGFLAGDRVVSVDSSPVAQVWDFRTLLEKASGDASVVVTRDGSRVALTVPSDLDALAAGLNFQTVTIPSPQYGFFGALGRGTVESVRILVTSVRSLRLLFEGVKLTSAVAGPVRISYFIGNVATSGFQIGFGVGLRSLANFLALLSVVLFFMNLLPIPVLDGGQILLALVELIRGRSPHPRTIYRYQLAGSLLVFALLFFALFGDVLFLAGR